MKIVTTAMKEGAMMIAITDTDTVLNVFAEKNIFPATDGALGM
jgi:predicted metal-dependent phosphoesterase TrpH